MLDIHQVRSMSHVRNGMLHVHQMLEQLVQQNRQCMKLVEKQRSLIKGSHHFLSHRVLMLSIP